MIIKKISLEIFYLLIIAFICFFVAEIIKPGLVSNSFDLNLLLAIITIWGIITLIINLFKKNDRRNNYKRIKEI